MSKGFTIIELIISIFILSIAVVGIFNAFSVMVILTADTSDRLTATYLAQEGMEIVRNIRDANWLKMDANPSSGYTWVDGLFVGATCSTAGCEADYRTNGTVAYPLVSYGSSGRYLYINTSGFYDYTNTGTLTKLKRKIKIEPVTDYIIKVTVEVSWNKKATILNPCNPPNTCSANTCGASNCITAQETLYNWY